MSGVPRHSRWAVLVVALAMGGSLPTSAAPLCRDLQTAGPAGTSVMPRLVGPAEPGDIGFLVVAPDRGFLGNEEIRDAFDLFSRSFRADLAFVPWEGDPMQYVRPALERLRTRGAHRVALLPLFLAPSHSLLVRLRDQVSALEGELAIAQPFGRSFLAEEILVDRLSAALNTVPGHHRSAGGSHESDVAVLLLGSGAINEAAAVSMQSELQHLLSTVGPRMGVVDSAAVVLRHGSAGREAFGASLQHAREEAERLAADHERVIVVPFHLGMRLDSMMDVNRSIRRRLADVGVELVDEGPLSHPAATVWMAREANRWIPLGEQEIGFVIMPHGADIGWNDSIRQPLERLVERRPIEYAFSMADSHVLARAVERLETRGCRGIVILRVFSLASSFRSRIEFLLGLGDDPGFMMAMEPPARVRSASVFVTLGGIEDDPLFAEALLARAREISNDPTNEAVLLLGHGAGRDEDNQVWLGNLESIADQMRDMGAEFASIRWANWREDWPNHREAAETEIHAIVEEERERGRTVLVIPARTTLVGPEKDELGDIDGVRIGVGFAPHPLFAEWVEGRLEQAADAIRSSVGWRPYAP